MATQSLQAALCHISRLAIRSHDLEIPDNRLLERFTSQKDTAAFAELVQRHGRMVMGVCRRILGDAHDSEDAFQATFLILLRRADTIAGRGTLAGWLYTVANHVALRARASSARRQECERRAMNRCNLFHYDTEQAWKDLRPVLDAELSRLPNRYREPLILCYLEGKTEQEAAQELACPLGTISWRLVRARSLLRDRLTRRGIALSTGMLGALMVEFAAAAVPLHTRNLTLSVVRAFTVNGPTSITTGIASARVSALTEGAIRAMIMSKMKALVIIPVAVSIIAACAVAIASGPIVPIAEQSAAKNKAKGTLTVDEFEKLHRHLVKMSTEKVWSIPWQLSVREARALAAKEKKPVFLWISSNGGTHPLGPC